MSNTGQSFAIDHVELPVDDRYEAAEWFADTLGFTINEAYEQWTEAGGPLLITSDDGSTHLALVEGHGNRAAEVRPGHVALRVPGSNFLDLIDQLNEMGVSSTDGSTIDRGELIDRDLAFAVMIQDPYGNRFELISYDHELVQDQLNR